MSSDGTVKFWDVRTRNIINEVKGLGEAFTLAWAPDGESLVVGNKVWRIELLYKDALVLMASCTGRYVIRSFTHTKHTVGISSADCPDQQYCVLLEWEADICHHF